jgi:tetratricopeptide (TPR) repeat protein
MVHMWFDWDWAGSEREAKRAISLNPNSGFSHLAYAQLLSTLGRHAEAIAEAARGRELDPVSLIGNAREGAMLYLARRNEEAKERLQKTFELDPNFWIAHLYLGKVYLQEGKYSEALDTFIKAKEFSRGNSETISMIGCTWARVGDAAKARAALDELKSLTAQRYVPPYNVAAVYGSLGEQDEAIAWLERAYKERDARLSWLKIEPMWDSFRSDPRFVAILKRIGLQ